MNTRKQTLNWPELALQYLRLSAFICGSIIPHFKPASAAEPSATDRPNIIFVITDDQRWDAMSCAGHPFLKTPNMDRLARGGVYFENAFVTTPLCSPSRSSFLTGQYVHTTGVKGNGADMNPIGHQLITFPRVLHEAGYEIAYVGKWHMGNDDSPRPGFDRWVSFKGQGRYNDPVLNVDGKQVEKQGYITDIITDYAVEFLNRKHAKPFVMYVGHKAVHGPFEPAPRHKQMYTNQPLPQRPNVKDDMKGKPALRRDSGPEPDGHPARGVGEKLIRNQLRCLLSVDEGLGRMLDALDEKKLAENTLVIFTSDNGYLWNEHDLGDKRAAYEESIRVPLLMRYPKVIKPGTRVPQMTLNIDIAPTAIELGGGKSPQKMHGRSLVPILEGKTPAWRDAALLEYFFEKPYPRVPGWSAVRTERWKYIAYDDHPDMHELYDLAADPYEMANVIDRPESAAALTQMKEQLAKLQDETK